MSVKNYKAAVAAWATLGQGGIGQGVAEGSLNDKPVKQQAAVVVEVAPGRQAIAVIMDDDGNGGQVARPVAGSDGGIKLYGNIQAAVAAMRRAGIGGVNVNMADKAASVGDPVKTLIAKHKSAVKEKTSVDSVVVDIASKIASAQALHWDTASPESPEGAEYADYLRRQAVVTEYQTAMSTLVQSLADSLTAAGIDPATYLPTGG